MLSNAYLLAKIGADTAENEQRFAEILPTDALGSPGTVWAGNEKQAAGIRRASQVRGGAAERR